ncbi:glycosyltransferase family 4 protein [Prevotella sp. E2-28]|uniref:glycosyltransferase family 4 protein n=1 Tax=Prevotella sp. E2-28 TaxID=2913620 RepID=UPI001EDB6761|nr:glycosyltransferase family 4 protein [Prevotella sp. E2-28]UKK54780.1 glycosyltransferase family 4 protein [Prevotella sp. E2-28]
MKDNKIHTVVMVGNSEHSGGGIASVINLIRKMPVWEKYGIKLLATQKDGNKLTKFWCVFKAAIKAPFVIARCKIVHFQMVPGITLLTQLPALLSAKLFRKKVVMSVHVGNQLENYASDRSFKWWFRRADLVLLLAKRWEKLFKESYADVKVSTDVLYNACEMRPFIPMEEKKKLILFAGTLDKNKALDLLLKAWASIKDKYPEWRIAVLGSGDRPYFEAMSNDLGCSDSVSFKGYVVGEEKELYFHDASILCLCSYMEGFPMAVLEAWSHGIAVVTTPVGGLPDVIEDGSNCVVFPTGDYMKLAEQLDSLISKESLRMRVGEEGYRCAQSKFSSEAISEKIDFIYSNLLENNHN